MGKREKHYRKSGKREEGKAEKSKHPNMPLSSSRSSKRTPSQSKEIKRKKSVNRGLKAVTSSLHMVSYHKPSIFFFHQWPSITTSPIDMNEVPLLRGALHPLSTRRNVLVILVHDPGSTVGAGLGAFAGVDVLELEVLNHSIRRRLVLLLARRQNLFQKF